MSPERLATESVSLSTITAMSVGTALTDLIVRHGAPIGPRPQYWRIAFDGGFRSAPSDLSAFFAPDTLDQAAVVVRIELSTHGAQPRWYLRVHVDEADRPAARRVLDHLIAAAAGSHDLYRGRLVRATRNPAGLDFEILPTPRIARADLVIAEDVWREIDEGLQSITTRAGLMTRIGLETQRGMLLCGPPGVGKTAIARVLAAELTGALTVVIVDPDIGATCLRAVYRETQQLGPSLVILEDLDLYAADRGSNGERRALGELLDVLDGTQRHSNVITLATTNDPRRLDKAAIRSARFDTVIHLDYPDRVAAAAILARYLRDLPSAALLDFVQICASLPDQVSGADLREIARRTVLAHGEDVDAARVCSVISAGRWRAGELAGNYL